MSMIDWDGVLSSVVFLSGCNWRCPFCHNFDLWKIKNEVAEEKVFSYLQNHKNWIEGVVILGGEPLMDEDVIPFIKKIRQMGFKIKVDTNGSMPDTLEKLIKKQLIDYVAMDIKTSLTEEKYEKATGVKETVPNVRKSMKLLFDSPIDFELRTTMVPEIVDEQDLRYNLRFIPQDAKYVLQQFSPENVKNIHFQNVAPYTDEKISEICEKLKKDGLKISVRGVV